MNALRLSRLVISGIFATMLLGMSCSEDSRLPSPSQQAVGLYKGELALVNEITGDTIESQGGITLRVDPMEPGVVKLSMIKLRFANIDVGNVNLDANIERLSETYLVLSAYNVRLSILQESLILQVYLSGWHNQNDIHLILRTTKPLESSATPEDVIIAYSGHRNGN